MAILRQHIDAIRMMLWLHSDWFGVGVALLLGWACARAMLFTHAVG